MVKKILTEKNLVLVLFVLIIVIFSFANENSRKIEKKYMEINTYTAKNFALLQRQTLENSPFINRKIEKTSDKDE